MSATSKSRDEDLPEEEEDTPAWSDGMARLWDQMTTAQRELFHGSAWDDPQEPMALVRELVAFMRQCRRHHGVTLDDLLSVQFEDGFGGGTHGKFHRMWARELWEHTDKEEAEAKAAEVPPVLRLRFGWEATLPQPLGTVVEGLLHAGSMTLIYGPPKSGKSFIAGDLGLSIAAKQPDWMGHKIVRPGPVLCVACEGHAGYWKRLAAEAKEHGWDESTYPMGFVLATGRPTLIKVDPNGVHFAPDPSAILEAIEAMKKRGLEPVAIIIDTVFRSFGVGNVNASQDMNIYLAAVAVLTDAGYAVALVHHEIKSGGTPAGSVALLGAADTVIHVWREAETSEQRFWQVEYAKDDAETKPRAFTLGWVEVGHDLEGRPASSCVIRDAGTAPDAVPQKKRGRQPSAGSDSAILADLIYDKLCDLLADPSEGQSLVLHPHAPPVRSVSRVKLRGTAMKAGILVPAENETDQKRVDEGNRTKFNRAINRLMRQRKVAANDKWIGLAKAGGT
jgi:hypothetical protein